MELGNSFRFNSFRVAIFSAVATALIGAFGVLGLFLDIPSLAGGFSHFKPIAFSSALGLIALGIVLAIRSLNPKHQGFKWFSFVAGLAVALIGFGTLCQFFFNPSIAIFRVFGLKLGESGQFGQASYLTGINLLFLGLALLSSGRQERERLSYLDLFVVIPICISLLAMIGFICGVPSFYGRTSLFPNTEMAVPTTIAFVFAAAGILASEPGHGISQLISSNTAGGVVARRLLLVPFLIPLATGISVLICIRMGIFNAEFAGWSISFVNLLASVCTIWWVAALLDREGCIRLAAEAEVRRANKILEQRVNERTAQLSQAAESARWLASFPEKNPNPILEIGLRDRVVHYINPAASRLFPDLKLNGFAHEWLAGLETETHELVHGNIDVFRREITCGPRCFSQTVNFVSGVDRLRVYGSDITDRRDIEDSLLKEKNLLRALIDHLPACIYVKDLEGRFLVYNAASVKLTGVDSETAALGKTVFDLFPFEIAKLYEDDDRKTLAGGVPLIDREEPTRDHHGVNRWFLTTKIPVRNKQGIIGLLGISQDITERKNNEQLLHDSLAREQEERRKARASEDQFRTLVEQSLIGIYAIQDGNFVYVNPTMEKIVGYPQAEMTGNPIWRFILPEDHGIVRENIRKRVEGEINEAHYSLRMRRKDGSIAFVEVRGARTDFNGRPAILGTLMDITDRKEAEEKIVRLNQELEERVRQRTAQLQAVNSELESFSYTVSHDLRAPLRHIHGYVEMLKRATEGKLSEKPERYLRTIAEASLEMGQLIDDLLAFSRVAKSELSERVVDLNSLVQDVLRSLEVSVQGRNIEWKLDINLPNVMGDSALLKQVFANLLGNAVKYTRGREKAEIEVGVAGDKHSRLILFVRDNGAGFDMQYAHKLFGVFQRLHRAEEFEGTGIGLATVRRIIQRHGGEIWAEAFLDKGAAFYFSLKPVAPPQYS